MFSDSPLSLASMRDQAIGYALLAGWIDQDEAERQCQDNRERYHRDIAVRRLFLLNKKHHA